MLFILNVHYNLQVMGTLVGSLSKMLHECTESRTRAIQRVNEMRAFMTGDPKFVDFKAVEFKVQLSAQLKANPNETIVYDKVTSNIGSAYSEQTGVFTCPVAGLYHFEVKANYREPNKGATFSKFSMDRRRKLHLYTNTETRYVGAARGGDVRVFRWLFKGDTVWVKTGVFGSHLRRKGNIFSGDRLPLMADTCE